ncbi:hypothetical protein L1987_09473 [Smallanthus sonchifolius]|uniref:Uncharacterized protein n=1 Tax=Smallanthus sonchifolius TaxID=185202 RepID=A0ACB9JPN7_9ASTR|nr:hypothetical protein L1987_09473 [Smallanthus sonchifolius]
MRAHNEVFVHKDNSSAMDIVAAVTAEPKWTRYKGKPFEEALMYPHDVIGRWQNTPMLTEQLSAHYKVLVHDLLLIESGQVELPSYADDSLLKLIENGITYSDE